MGERTAGHRPGLRGKRDPLRYTGTGTNTQTDRYWGHSWYLWNNTGEDQATLKNRSGTVIDRCSYTGTSTSFKIC